MPILDLTPSEFISMAQQEKIRLLTIMAARDLELGEQYALAAARFYRAKYGRPKGAPDPENYANLSGEKEQLEIEWDALKHAQTAIQSALAAERRMAE